jgi:hypothetical protein
VNVLDQPPEGPSCLIGSPHRPRHPASTLTQKGRLAVNPPSSHRHPGRRRARRAGCSCQRATARRRGARAARHAARLLRRAARAHRPRALMAWGLVLTLFFAVFFPVYWLRSRPPDKQDRGCSPPGRPGRGAVHENCASCHGTPAPGRRGGRRPTTTSRSGRRRTCCNIVARYADNPNIVDIERLHRGDAVPRPSGHADARLGRGRRRSADRRPGRGDHQLWILANQDDEETPRRRRRETGRSSAARTVHGELRQVPRRGLEGIVGGPPRTLQGVFERHSEDSILGILQNGIKVPGSA